MNKDTESYIEHEVRIRLLEKISEKIDIRFENLENKIDSHFKWTLGTMIALFGSTFLPLFGGIILHMAKLI
jgi:hypothetical protein